MTKTVTEDPYGAIVSWVDRSAGDGPLRGLRLGVKDLIAVAGVPRLCGAPAMVDPAPQPHDATVVARLVSAGAHVVATTVTHEFGWGVITPGTVNPRAADRIAGGSSGGSAAALAGGIVDGALGTDTAGSIRIPAACCGVTGLRPTHGSLPLDGVQPLAPSFDAVGPMARDVSTLGALYAALSGGRAPAPLPPTLRVGVVRQVEDGPVDPQVRRAVAQALDGLGGRVQRVDVDLPELTAAGAAMMLVLAAEEANVHAPTLAEHADRLSPSVRESLVRSARLTNDEVLAARRTVALWRGRMRGVFTQVDVLVLPVLPCPVPAVGQRGVVVEGVEERTSAALTRLNTPWSAAGLPAGAVPAGRDSGGGPIGVQVVAAWDAEPLLLSALALVEDAAGGPWPPAVSR